MKRVKFLRSHKMYQPGEKAGFDDKIADALIAAGFAVDPEKKGKTAAATADVLVNPGDLSQDGEVELQTRVQTSIEPASGGLKIPNPENAPAASEASKETAAKPAEQQASAAAKPKAAAKTDAKKG